MTTIKHPRFEDLEVIAVNGTSPSFDGAVCAQVGEHIWYFPDYEDELGRGAYIESDSGGDNTIANTQNVLADICSNCPALAECFNYAVHHEKWGFWGGTTRKQRKELRATHGITLTEPFNSDAADRMILETRALIEMLGDDDYGDSL
jgi:hypothetical protein